MKLNFWQILGILLILAYLVLWMTGVVGSDKDPVAPPPATTTPAATTTAQ